MIDQKETTDELESADAALFDGAEDEIETEVVDEVETPAETPADEAKAEAEGDGIAKAEDAPQEAVEPPKANEPAVTPEGMMPYGAYAGEKSKRVAMETEFAEYKQQTTAETARLKAELALLQQQIPKPQAPDMYDDPEGFAQHQAQSFEKQQLEYAMNIARMSAPAIVSQDDIAAAEAYLAQRGIPQSAIDQEYANAIRQGKNPIVEMVNWHKSQTELSEFQAWKAAQATAQAQPVATPQQPAPAAPNLPPNVAGIAAASSPNTAASLDDVDAELFG